MMRKPRKKRNESGQVLFEFILVMIIMMTMILAVVQVAWGLAYGHYAHYATFMAARAYMSAGHSKQEQVSAASSTLKAFLKQNDGMKDLIPFLAKSRKGDTRDIQGGPEEVDGAFIGTHPQANGKESSRFFSFAEGVQYNFEVPLFIFPLVKFVKGKEGEKISIGKGSEEIKGVEWNGGIPFTSDAWLGREPTTAECFEEMDRFSNAGNMRRMDGSVFIVDNGC